jgi:DNA-binding HxlR family transcriptional regulator
MGRHVCPVFRSAELLGRKWTISLLQEISLYGDRGFNFLLRRMRKLTPKVLAVRLKELELEGIVERTVLPGKVAATQYALTEKGMELMQLLAALKQWNLKYSPVALPCGKMACVECQLY